MEEELYGKSTKPTNILKPMSISDLYGTEYPETEWLVESLIATSSVNILSGIPGQFKSWITQELARCVSLGIPFLGHFKTVQESVLIVDEETHPRHIKKRLKMLGVPVDAPISILAGAGVRIDVEKSFKELVRIVRENNIGLIIFDSLIRFHGGDENSAQDMKQVLGKFRSMLDPAVAILITHHHRKTGAFSQSVSQNLRGSSDILASVELQLAVEVIRDENPKTLELIMNKMRVSEGIPPFKVIATATSNPDTMRLEYAGNSDEHRKQKAIAKEVIIKSLADGPLSKSELEQRVRSVASIGFGSIAKALNDLATDGKISIERGANNRMTFSLVDHQGDHK